MLWRPEATILQQIAVASRQFAKSLPASSSTPSLLPHLSTELPTDDIFPAPKSLTSDLLASGFDIVIAEKISQAYLKAASRLRHKYEVQYRRTSHIYLQNDSSGCFDFPKLHSLLRSANASIYANTLQSWIDEIATKFAPFILPARQAKDQVIEISASERKQTRRPFNQNGVPILELFFEQNCRPSRAEKHDLAVKTGMQYQQINVWFQNRRSRSKQDCQGLSNAVNHVALPPELEDCVTELFSAGDRLNKDRSTQDGPVDEPLEQSFSDSRCSTFNLGRPQHAYPSSYPPSCPYNPFPIHEDLRIFSTPWFRSPTSSRYQRSASLDVEELTYLFGRMNVNDQPHIIKLCKANVPRTASCDTLRNHSVPPLGFATIVPPAPLPALLTTTTTTRPFLSVVVPLPSSYTRAFRSHMAVSQGSNLQSYVPPIQTKEAISKRNVVASSSKSAPTTGNVHHNFSPAVLNTSSASASRLRVSSATAMLGPNTPSEMDPCITVRPSRHPQPPLSPRVSSPTLSMTLPPSLEPTAPSSKTDHQVSTPPYDRSRIASGGSAAKRKIAAIPRRVPNASSLPINSIPSKPMSSRFPPSSRPVSSLSRMSSISSISSVSSCETSSPSSSESDGLPTPPLLPMNLPAPDIFQSAFVLGSQSASGGVFGECPANDLLPIEGFQLDSLCSASVGQLEVQKKSRELLPV